MKSKQSIFWGVVLIVVGLIFLGNNLNIWNINIFFNGWWTLFIIIPSIYGLFEKHNFYCSLISLSFGVLLLLAAQNIIAWGMIWKILVPIIIIVLGLIILFGNRKSKRVTNAKEYIAIFGGVDEKINEVTSDFTSVSIFGGIDLDLRKAKLKKDLVIECLTIFGGIELKMPDNVKLVLNGIPVFGGVDNRYDNDETSKITIYINYTCIFGGIDII